MTGILGDIEKCPEGWLICANREKAGEGDISMTRAREGRSFDLLWAPQKQGSTRRQGHGGDSSDLAPVQLQLIACCCGLDLELSGGGLVTELSLTLATPWTVEPARLLCPWDLPGNNTAEGCLPGFKSQFYH